MVRLSLSLVWAGASASLSLPLQGYAQAASTSSGQAYANKIVRTVTLAPGGGIDIAVRVVAQKLSEKWVAIYTRFCCQKC